MKKATDITRRDLARAIFTAACEHVAPYRLLADARRVKEAAAVLMNNECIGNEPALLTRASWHLFH